MRYICDNHRTNSLLRAWAGSREVLIAKFFFWRAGSSVQKTIVGLLRSLLYQIFSALPELIGIVSADNVSPVSQHAALPAWTEARLHKYLKALLWKLVKSHRVCFFLDGLDELDQKHERMVSMVRDLTEDENVKICLSSRPYRIFSDSFSSSAMLKLQDLTEADIRTYISESLLPRGSIPILEESGATSSMSEIIVERADGVFLWAELVVREVNRGITNEDSQQQLVNRLNSLPDEIEQLYSYMLGCIDTVYKNEAARCFAATSRGFCSLLQLSLVILEGNRDDHPVAFADLSAAQTLDLCNSTARRLPTTCAGLLEVQENRHIFGVIADNNLLSDVARLILPLQFAAPVTDPDEIPQGVLEVLRIQLCTSVQSVHRTALDFLQENSVGIKFMKDHNGYAVHDSVSRLHRMVATWRLLGCIDLSQYVTESKEYRKWAGRSHTEKSLPGFLDLRRFRDNAMENLLIRAVRTESITATAQSALWDYVERATIVTNSQYLTKLKGGPCLQLPHSSCMIEPAPREDQCDEKSVTLGSKIEDSPQTADRNVINAGDEAPMMVSSMPEDFLGFAAFYSLSLYVEYRFHSEMGLQDRNKVTYLLACFVSNIVWSVSEDQEKDLGENLDEQADAHRLLQFLRGLLDRGADPNALTASSTIWGNFLEHLYSAYHRDLIYGKTFSRTVWASMTMVFLDKGADTARIWNLRSGALWRFDFALAGDDWVDIILEVADFENFLFGFNKSFSTFTILHKCLRDCDEWAYISNKLNASQKEHISKCTRFYFSHPGPEGWEPFIGYALSDQQSKDFLHVFEGFLETPSEYTRLRLELADHVLDLRRELEKERSGAGTTLVERTGISR